MNARFLAQKAAFIGRTARTCSERLEALDALLDALLRFENRLVDALKHDFGNRSAQETRLLEISPAAGVLLL